MTMTSLPEFTSLVEWLYKILVVHNCDIGCLVSVLCLAPFPRYCDLLAESRAFFIPTHRTFEVPVRGVVAPSEFRYDV